jgi:histidinol dehydrogenase
MVSYLKKAAPPSRQDNRTLTERVRAMLEDIEQNRDEAVRRYARDLDHWERQEFRVSEAEIATARRNVSAVFKDDFAFCKTQVTEFAKRQRDSMQEFEAEVAGNVRSIPSRRSATLLPVWTAFPAHAAMFYDAAANAKPPIIAPSTTKSISPFGAAGPCPLSTLKK